RAPFAELTDRLYSAQAEVGEVERELRVAAESIPDDPGRLDVVRARRRALRELERKYGDTLADVVAFGAATRTRVAELEGYEERASTLEAARDAARREAESAAGALSAGPPPGAGLLAHAAAAPLPEPATAPP